MLFCSLNLLNKINEAGEVLMKKRIFTIILLLLVAFSLYSCDDTVDIDVQIIDENGETGESINPTTTGKITIINFWGVWCPYCLYEMPELDKLATDYENEINVIAVHSYYYNDKAPEFIEEYFKDSKITFARDTGGDELYMSLGGEDSYPYTVVFDANGKIISSFYGANDYEYFESTFKHLIEK